MNTAKETPPPQEQRQVAFIENLMAHEAMYCESRRQGMNLTDKQIGDLLRAAASYLGRQQ